MTFSQNILKDLINSIAPISNKEFKQLITIFSEKSLKRGSKPITFGETSNLILFVTKGLLREYTVINNEEHTLWITGIGEAVLDPGSFMVGEPSKIEVEALVNSHILYTTRQQLENVLFQIPAVNTEAHVLYQKTFKILENICFCSKSGQRRKDKKYYSKRNRICYERK